MHYKYDIIVRYIAEHDMRGVAAAAMSASLGTAELVVLAAPH